MSTYTVQAVEKIKDYPGKDGRPPVPIYKLTLANGQGQTGDAELFDNTGLNPQVGQQIEGAVEGTEYGNKFKPVRKPGGRPGKSPEERRSIERQAMVYASVGFYSGKDVEPLRVVETAELFWNWVSQS